MDLVDLQGPEGRDNTPGMKTKLWLAPESWFAAIQGFKSTNLPGDAVTIDGIHTFKAGFGFIEVYSTLDSNELKAEAVGERDGRGKKITFEFFHPGNKKEVAEFDRMIKNHSCIMIVETVEGEKIQIGSEGLGAEVLGSYGSGKLSGGRRGFTFIAEAYANGLAFYEGTISLKRDVVVGP